VRVSGFGVAARCNTILAVPSLSGGVGGWGLLSCHAVAPLKDKPHPLQGRQRIKLIFRKAA